jgi:hypothetical protein
MVAFLTFTAQETKNLLSVGRAVTEEAGNQSLNHTSTRKWKKTLNQSSLHCYREGAISKPCRPKW